ncbi:MAG: glycosyltransferase family 4 protein, partial [Thiobacillaceae bacterium]
MVSTEFPPSLGGVETYAWEYSKELVRRGHEVTVFTAPQADGLAELPGARVLPLLRRRRKHDRNVLRQHRVDVWHVMNAGYAWLALDLPEPVIASVHGNDFLRPYVLAARLDLFNHWRPLRSFFEPLDIKLGIYRSARLMRKAFRKVRHILANSHFTERVFLEHFPDCQGKTSTAWVGVANEFFSIEHIPGQGDAPRLL